MATVLVASIATLALPSVSSASNPPVVVKTSGIVSVVKSGFIRVTYPGIGSELQFGLELRNTSQRLAALGVQVTVTFSVKGKGTEGYPSSSLLTGIPAGGNFYLGGSSLGNLKPTTMRVVVHVERTSSGHLVLPPVTKAAITGSLLPKASVTIEDPYSQKVMSNSDGVAGTLYIIYFGSHGQVVGSDQLDLQSQLGFPAAGKRQTYNATTGAPPNAVGVHASVDPCSNAIGLDTNCIAFQ
jgi:hypothetical protein